MKIGMRFGAVAFTAMGILSAGAVGCAVHEEARPVVRRPVVEERAVVREPVVRENVYVR